MKDPRSAKAATVPSLPEGADPLERRRIWLDSPRGKARVALATTSSFLLMCLVATAMSVVAAATLFKKRRLYTEVLGGWLARSTLAVVGVKVAVHGSRPEPGGQVIYISNHTSTLDVYILLALGFPNARYFMRGKLRRILPLGVITHLMGTFFTPSQRRPEARVRCFQRAERVLRRTGESVYLSPEGKRVTTGEIGHFNKGTFHLATNLGAPIVPIYIDIPPGVDPGLGYAVMPGTVAVYYLPVVETSGWKLEDLLANKERVRDTFLRFHERLRSGGREEESHVDR